MASQVDNNIIDGLHIRIQKLVDSGAVFKVHSLKGPKEIVVTQGDILNSLESASLPLIPVGMISYKELKAQPFAVGIDGKLSADIQSIEAKIDKFATDLLKPGTEITLQLMGDTYYYQDELLKRESKSQGIPCIIYIKSKGNDTYQNIMVRNGFALYDNREYFRLKDVFLSQGSIDRQLTEELSDSGILAIQDTKGFWDKEYASSKNISKIVEVLNVKAKQNQGVLKTEVERINKFKTDRARDKRTPQERLDERRKAIQKEKDSFNRKFSEGTFGDALSAKSKKYFPASTSEEIIKQVVAGILPKSVIQIGALWSGIPTYEEEKAGLGASSHPVEIVEVRKDGDIKPVLGQGFMSMVMGDRPPNEGLTFVFSVNSRGIETFIAPLITQFRMDPIIPIRNIHLARFTRPIFSNREFYSKVFGKLPENLAKLVNQDGKYNVDNQEDIRLLSRTLDLIYLTVPVYVAVKQVEVQNLNRNDGSFSVTINCGIADVAENFGVFPEYFKTVDDAFEIHKKRVTVIDKIKTEKAIRYIAKQIGAGKVVSTFKIQSGDLSVDESIAKIKEYDLIVKASGRDSLNLSSFALRESKLVEIPQKISIAEAKNQALFKNRTLANRETSLVKFKNLLVYKPGIATVANYNLIKNLLGVNNLKASDISLVIQHFDVSQNASQIPIPAGPSTKYRNGRITKQDLTSVGFLTTAINVEKATLMDPKLLEGPAAIGTLFGVSKIGFKAYKYGYSNWKDNAVIGLGTTPVLKPFELCAVRNVESGANVTLTSMDVEYAASIGFPVLKISSVLKNYELDIVGLVTGFQTVVAKGTGKLIFDRKPLTFYDGNLKAINRNIGIIDVPNTDNYTKTLEDIVNNSSSAKSTSFCPEITATFGYAFSRPLVPPKTTNPKDKRKDLPAGDKKIEDVGTVAGQYGTIKFHNANYRSLIATTSADRRNELNVSLDARSTTTFVRDIISQKVEIWNNVINNIVGSEKKEPLEFEVQYRLKNESKRVVIGFTDFLQSDLGSDLFFFREKPKKAGEIGESIILRSSKYRDELVSLVGTYISELGNIKDTTTEAKPAVDKTKAEAIAKTNSTIANVLKTKRSQIRNIVQGIINKDTNNLLEINDIPSALTDMSQILSAMKGFKGTHFLDESEPYVFSLFYQLGIVDAGKYTMTFKVRPDRVPYVDPGFISEDYETMNMSIYRSEPPKEEDRVDAYSEALKRNEELITRINGEDDFNSYISAEAIRIIQTIKGTNSTSVVDSQQNKDDLRRPIYVIGAIHKALLTYFDVLYSVHILAKSGSILLSQGTKVETPDDVNRRQEGLIDKHVKIFIEKEAQVFKDKIQAISNKLKILKRTEPNLLAGELVGSQPSPLGARPPSDTIKVINLILADLKKVIDVVDDRIYESKSANGKHFITIENIKRFLNFAVIDHPSVVTANTTRVLNTLFSTYAQLIDNLVDSKQSTRLYELRKGDIKLKAPISTSIANLNGVMQSIVSQVRAIRLATGHSLDFVKRKTLSLKKPIPQIGIIEEYGVSEPLRIPGRKKPTYQVIGSTSTQAYIQLTTNISEVYLSENSKLQNLIEDEEGIDAIYNILREPSDITTVYNMLRSGRAMVRDATVFTNGSNTLFKTNNSSDTLQNAFRLVRKASVIAANIDAYGTLVGMTQPHVEIKEPLFQALGLSKFVAKTTKISSGTDTTSWKVDIYLLPYEAGYTTNRNLKKVNKSLTNEQFGNINAWFGAAHNPAAELPGFGGDGNTLDKLDKATSQSSFVISTLVEDPKKATAVPRDAKTYTQKILTTRFAMAAVFSNLVAIHAIYKAKQKIDLGIVDKFTAHPEEFGNVDSSTATLTNSRKKYISKRKDLVTELDLKATDISISNNYAELGQTGTVPISSIIATHGLGQVGASVGLGVLGSQGGSIFKKVTSDSFRALLAKKTQSIGGVLKGAGKVLGVVTQFADLGFDWMKTSPSNVKQNQQNSSVFDQNLLNNISVHILLSQNFSIHAIEFLQDFYIAEANSTGGGQKFIELMSKEAQSVISNAGSLNGIQYFNDATLDEGSQLVSTSSGAFVSTYPVDSLIQKGQQQNFFILNGKQIENVSIVVVNTAVAGDASVNADDIPSKLMFKDFYDNGKGSVGVAKSVFNRYYLNINSRTQVDLCGEELVQLLVDGQAAMFKTDIYSVALNPKYVAAEPGLYYAVMQGITGRLKINQFAEYLIGPLTATIHAKKVNDLFGEQTQLSFYLRSFLGITTTGGIIKKPDSSELFKKRLLSYAPETRKGAIEYLVTNFPLANGKVIFSKIQNMMTYYIEVSNTVKFDRPTIATLDSILRSGHELCKQLADQIPVNKRNRLPVPNLFSTISFFGADINGYTLGDQLENLPESVVIPQNNTLGDLEQKVKSIKKEPDKLSETQLTQFRTQYKESLVDHTVWLLDAYGTFLVGTSQTSMIQADPSYELRNAIFNQLATDRAQELGIDPTLAADEIRQASAKDVKEYLATGKTNFADDAYAKTQKACDEIALYSNGNSLGKRALYNEYAVFLDTFKELFLQPGFSKSDNGTITKGFEIGQETAVSDYSYLKVRGNDIWGNLDTVGIEAIENAVGIKISPSLDSFRKIKSLGGYTPNTLSNFSDIKLTSDGVATATSVNNFATIRYGIERPEYIPAILAVFSIDSNNNLSIHRSDVCVDLLSKYSSLFFMEWQDRLKKTLKIHLSGNAPPFSGAAFGAAFSTSLNLAFLTKHPVVGAIVFVVSFIGILILQATYLKEVPNLTDFNNTLMGLLRSQVTSTRIVATPLFTGMKALLTFAEQINDSDLSIISELGCKYAREGSRKNIYVYPPDVDQTVQASEYIIQDTLSYLTLPLITKRQVTTVADVLTPGGNIVPDVKQINENQKVLASTLLVQEAFFKDHLEKLPEIVAIEKAKALGINASNINTNPAEPNDPGKQDYAWFKGAIKYINNMEGIFPGDLRLSNIGNQYISSIEPDVAGSNNFVLKSNDQLGYIYNRLAPYVAVGYDSGTTDELGRKVYKKTSAAVDADLITIASNLFPQENTVLESANKAAAEKGYSDTKNPIGLYLAQNVFYLGSRAPSALVNGSDTFNFKEYSFFANRAILIPSISGTAKSDTALAFVKLGNRVPSTSLIQAAYETFITKEASKGLEGIWNSKSNFIIHDYAIWGNANFGQLTIPKIYFKGASNEIIEVVGNKRGKSFNKDALSISNAHSFIMREASAESMLHKRAEQATELEGFFLKLNSSNLLGSADVCFIAKKGALSKNTTFTDRILYIFNRNIDQTAINTLKADGVTYIAAAAAFNRVYSSLADTQYMFIKPKFDNNITLSFVELYATKLAMDERSDNTGISVKWIHIFQALDDIGNFLAYIGFAAEVKNKSGATVESAIKIDKTDKVSEATGATDVGKLAQSNSVGGDSTNGVFAATTGLTTQYIMDKLDQFVDTESSLQWDVFGKASKEIRNIINAPLRMYPVGKVYFVKKERGANTLYDDIYSYADVLSIKVFDSSKTPGTTVLIQLANTENKLDNIIAAKDNSKNPFETRARADDPLSGLMLKAGTRIMIVLGYGNVLTEDNKYVCEIEQTSTNPDGTVTITGRGPGWILNNQINGGNLGKDGELPGKTISIPGSKLLTAVMPSTETDKKSVSISELANPQNAISRSLIMYTLIEIGKISRYGRLGSVLSELVEDSQFAIPDNISEDYEFLVKTGLQANGVRFEEVVANIKEKVSRALVGNLAFDAAGIYQNKINGGSVGAIFSVNTFSKNILLSESYPSVSGTFSSFTQWLINKYLQSAGRTIPEWKLNNESYWEFIKEVLLPVPNAKAFVRTYETDGSLVVGQADEYYSLYKSKSYTSRMADQIFKNISTLKETNSVYELLNRFSGLFKEISITPEKETVEMVAEILATAIGSIAFNDIDRQPINDILKKISKATFPLPAIENQSSANISELFTQLKNPAVQSLMISELLTIIAKAFGSNALTAEAIIKLPISKRYELFEITFSVLFKDIEKNKSLARQDESKLLEIAMDLGFSGTIKPETILAVKNAVSSADSENSFGKRILFTLTLAVCRAFNNKMHKLRILSPDKRKVQEQFYMFSGRDIIHNNASTMLGYNEGQFVFEEISSGLGEEVGSIANVVPLAGAITNFFAQTISRFDFAVDPVSSESGGTGDYTAKKVLVNLKNPGYFSAFMSIGHVLVGKRGPIITVLSMMATTQMQELVKDWYGGEIFAYGDIEKKPHDIVFMTDAIRDMYGPFEIKEVVHTFDNTGFISAYSPSVYTRSEPRNITDETGGSTANILVNVVLTGLAGLAIWKGGQAAAKILGKTGFAKTLMKFDMAATKGIATMLTGGITSKVGGRISQFGMALARKIIIDPVLKNSKYAVVSARLIAKKTIDSLKKVRSEKELNELYAKANGFTTPSELAVLLEAAEQRVKKAKPLEDARRFFAGTNEADVFTYTLNNTEFKISRTQLSEIENLLEKVFSKDPSGIINGLKNASKIEAGTADFAKLAKKFDELGINTLTLNAVEFGSSINLFNDIHNFFHFIEGKAFAGRVVDNISGVTNIKNITKTLELADESVVAAVTNFSIERLAEINKGSKSGKTKAFADVVDEFSSNLPDKTVLGLQEAFVGVNDAASQNRIMLQFFTVLEERVAKNSSAAIKIGSTNVEISAEVLTAFKALQFNKTRQGLDLSKYVTDQVAAIQKELASPVDFKGLSKTAQELITSSGETFIAQSETVLKKYSENIKLINKNIQKTNKLSDGTAKTEQLITLNAQLAEINRKQGVVEAEIKVFKNTRDSNTVRTQAAKSLEDAVTKNSANLKEASVNIANSQLLEIQKDALFSRIISSAGETGKFQKAGFNAVRGVTRDTRAIMLSKDPKNGIGSIMKSLSQSYGFYQIYSTVRSVVGESISEYRLLLGKVAASNSLITEFMIYKGEPFLSNLEGLTRNASKLITADASYLDYLKSRFYNPSEVIDFVRDGYSGIVDNSLTQYSDLLAISTIDSGLHNSLDSDLSFNSLTGLSSGSGGGDSGSVLNVTPGTLANPFGSGVDRLINLDSYFGWRVEDVDGVKGAYFHNGLDLWCNGFARYSKDIATMEAKNSILAFEDSILLVPRKTSFAGYSADLNATSYGLKGDPNDTNAPIILFGLTTGIAWQILHIMPTTRGINQNDLTSGQQTRLVKAGEKIAIVGPFGLTQAAHIHVQANQMVKSPRSDIFRKWMAAHKQGGIAAVASSFGSSLEKDARAIAPVGGVEGGYSGKGMFEPIDPQDILTKAEFGLVSFINQNLRDTPDWSRQRGFPRERRITYTNEAGLEFANSVGVKFKERKITLTSK